MKKMDVRLPKKEVTNKLFKFLPIEILSIVAVVLIFDFQMIVIAVIVAVFGVSHFINYHLSTRYIYLTLTEDGFNYKNLRGRKVSHSWKDELSIKSSKLAGHSSIKIVEKGLLNGTEVPTAALNQADVASFIKTASPCNHKFREFLNADS